MIVFYKIFIAVEIATECDDVIACLHPFNASSHVLAKLLFEMSF